MRIVFVISLVANLVLTGVTLTVGPSRMVIHFGADGTPNGWASNTANALIMTAINVVLFVSFYFAPYLMRITPTRWISLPNKDYWMRDENRGRMEATMNRHLFDFGTLTFVFMFIVGLLVLRANMANPVRLREDLFWWPFGLYMAYTAYWTVKVLLAFRVPKDARNRMYGMAPA